MDAETLTKILLFAGLVVVIAWSITKDISTFKKIKKIPELDVLDQPKQFLYLAKNYDLKRKHLLALMEALAEHQSPIGEVHEMVFAKLRKFRMLDPEEKERFYRMYEFVHERGWEFDHIIDLIEGNSMVSA